VRGSAVTVAAVLCVCCGSVRVGVCLLVLHARKANFNYELSATNTQGAPAHAKKIERCYTWLCCIISVYLDVPTVEALEMSSSLKDSASFPTEAPLAVAFATATLPALVAMLLFLRVSPVGKLALLQILLKIGETGLCSLKKSSKAGPRRLGFVPLKFWQKKNQATGHSLVKSVSRDGLLAAP